MMQRKWSPGSLYVIVIIGLVFVFMGCCKKPVQTVSMGTGQATEQELAAQKHASVEKSSVKPIEGKSATYGPAASGESVADKKMTAGKPVKEKGTLRVDYTVKKGDSLWWIAKYRDIYNDPYLWPIVYDANKNVMKDPNKIYPGMKLQIPRAGYKPADIQNARKQAGACKPYDPPARALPPAD